MINILEQQQTLIFLQSLYEWSSKLPLIGKLSLKNQQKLFIKSWHSIFFLLYSINFGENILSNFFYLKI